MTNKYDIEDMEQLTEAHEVQVANGDWFPVYVDPPQFEDDNDYHYIRGNNAPKWVPPESFTAREGLVALCCAGLITGVREIAKNPCDERADKPALVLPKFKIGDKVRVSRAVTIGDNELVGTIVEVDERHYAKWGFWLYTIESEDGESTFCAEKNLTAVVEQDPRDDIDLDALQMAEVYDELERDERNRAIELEMAKECVRKLNDHLQNL